MESRKISENPTSETIGWEPVAGATGYRFTVEGKRSHTWDPARDQVRIAKGKPLLVEALGVLDTGTWPDEDPPPPGGKLTWSPPALQNPKTVTLTNQVGLTIDGNGGDILVNPGFHRTVPWAAGTNQVVTFTNFRNLIMRATRQTVNYGAQDDNSNRHGMHFDNFTGHAFLEGVLWDGGPLRPFVVGHAGAPVGTVTVQNSRIVGVRDNRRIMGGDKQHSDIMMWWSKGGVFQLDKCSFEYDNTGFAFYDGTTNPGQGPVRFDARRVNLRHHPAASFFGNVFYHAVSLQTRSTAVDCWATTNLSQYTGGNPKSLQDAIGWVQNYPNPAYIFTPYKVTRPSTGAVLNVPDQATHNSVGTTNQMGRVQGDYIERQRPEMQGERWNFGVPSGGDFCPDGVAGVGYVSPGYA